MMKIEQDWSSTTDCHAWVEKPDGSILDWHFFDYDTIIRVQGLEKGITVYMPDDKYHKTCMTQVRKKIRQIKNAGIPMLSTTKDILKFFYDQPAAGNCFMNAYSYVYFNRDCKLRVGNFGWAKKKRTKNINTWFEFGDADMKEDWKYYYKKYPANDKLNMEVVGAGPWNEPYIADAAINRAAMERGVSRKQVEQMRRKLAEMIAEEGTDGIEVVDGITISPEDIKSDEDIESILRRELKRNRSK